MPKLRRPDGRVVSVSRAGVEALKGRGYTDPEAKPKPERDAVQGGRPSPQDPKAAWVEYAEACGVDAKDLTKAELVERLGSDGNDLKEQPHGGF